jgi:FkbM family methyltransferase
MERCFEKHNFQELNNFDCGMLTNAIYFYKNYFINRGEKEIYFDIGCNAGSFVKVLNNFGIKNDIHCFEPHPIISKTTKEYYPHIIMNNYCLGNTNENINMYIPIWSVVLSSIINRPVFKNLNQEISYFNVKCETLDSYCSDHNIDEIAFMKVDVEGAEKMVFEGAHLMLKNKKIKCGVFEIGETLKDAGTSDREICELLENYGYTINKNISKNDYIFHL